MPSCNKCGESVPGLTEDICPKCEDRMWDEASAADWADADVEVEEAADGDGSPD